MSRFFMVQCVNCLTYFTYLPSEAS